MLISKGAFFNARAADILGPRSRLPEPALFVPLDYIQGLEIDNFGAIEFARILGN